MEADWDLHAVVRGINKNTTTDAGRCGSTAVVVSSSNRDVKRADEKKHHLAVAEELHELYTPQYFLNPPQTQSVQPTISSYLAALEGAKKRTQQLQQHKGQPLFGTISTSTPATTTTVSAAAAQISHKPKRRKYQLKKVCLVPAEALSSDIWSWRKYGQKPIKGSPYPRGYYKCSSSKACLARKQVERNQTDPTKFIVTYTADHNHPAPTYTNSLAGTSRNPIPLSSESNLPTSKHSSSSSMGTMSPTASLDDEVLQLSNEMESKAVDIADIISRTNLMDDAMRFLDMDVTDDFFQHLQATGASPPPDQVLPRYLEQQPAANLWVPA